MVAVLGDPNSIPMKHWLRVFQFFRPDAARLGLMLLLMLAGTAANLVKPWPVAIIVDSVLGSKPFPQWISATLDGVDKNYFILLGALVIVVLHFTQGILSTWQNYLGIRIGLCGLYRVRNELFACLQRLSWRFHQGSQTGDLIYRATWDTYAFQTAFQQGLVTALTAALSLIFMVAVMLRLNVILTLVALGTLPLLLISIRAFGRRMRECGVAAQQADSQVTSLVQQNITALPLIQGFTHEAREQQRFVKQTAVAQEKRLSQHGWELLYGLGITIVFGLGTAAIVWVGANQVLERNLTIGELLVFLAYLGQLYDPLNQLSHVGATVSAARAGTQRVLEILDAPEDVKDRPDARPVVGASAGAAGPPSGKSVPVPAVTPLVVRGEIAFEAVCFSYQKEVPVLRDISFSVPGGQSVAILGPSGAGKTTLLRLLPRFYDPLSGAVKLDGIDLRDLRLTDLRRQIALVFQESILLPGTIAENIALGRSGATPAEIEAAARAANAHEFIQRLPHKYDTVVGEGATRVSVGENQRIGLARAYLKDAPILLLDEPTSSLDANSESLILASLARLMQGRTTLIVAHRLSTVRGVDRIVVLDAGRVVEQGAPSELLKSPQGYYHRMLEQSRALDYM